MRSAAGFKFVAVRWGLVLLRHSPGCCLAHRGESLMRSTQQFVARCCLRGVGMIHRPPDILTQVPALALLLEYLLDAPAAEGAGNLPDYDSLPYPRRVRQRSSCLSTFPSSYRS